MDRWGGEGNARERREDRKSDYSERARGQLWTAAASGGRKLMPGLKLVRGRRASINQINVAAEFREIQSDYKYIVRCRLQFGRRIVTSGWHCTIGPQITNRVLT